MKKIRLPFLAAEIILLLMLIFCVSKIFNQNIPQKRVAVILPDSGDEGWDLLIAGMKQAAKEENIHLIICNTDELESAKVQEETIKEQLNNNIDGMILRPAPGVDTEEMLKENCGSIPLMLVTEDVYKEAGKDEKDKKDKNSSSGYPVIAPDYYDLGYELGKQVEVKNPKVGIVAGWQQDTSTLRTIEGLSDALGEIGGEISWYCYQKKGADVLEQIGSKPSVDVLMVLDSKSLDEIGQQSAKGYYKGALVYGVGTGEKSIAFLDSGNIQGLILYDSYEIGYQGVLEISGKLKSSTYEMKSYETDRKLVDRETIFSDEEMEKFLYFSQ